MQFSSDLVGYDLDFGDGSRHAYDRLADDLATRDRVVQWRRRWRPTMVAAPKSPLGGLLDPLRTFSAPAVIPTPEHGGLLEPLRTFSAPAVIPTPEHGGLLEPLRTFSAPAVIPTPEHGDCAATSRARTTRAGRKPSLFKLDLWRIIQKVFGKEPGLEGQAFWQRVDCEGGKPLPDWMANGCPKKLADAFAHKVWKTRLNSEKARATQKLRNSRSAV